VDMEATSIIELNTRHVLELSIVVLWLGMYLTKKIKFLSDFNIPAPVTGGLICSILVALLEVLTEIKVNFDLTIRDSLLLIFFSTIGLSANLRLLIEGGKALIVILFAATVYLMLQNTIGISVATMIEGHPAYGLLAGSVSFAGGHGTGITYGQLFADKYGLPGTVEVAMACATFGLICGGLVGGPIAKYLIAKHNLKPDEEVSVESKSIKAQVKDSLVNMDVIINATFILSICIGVGEHIHGWLETKDITMPLYLPSLFVGIIITNIADLFKIKRSERFLDAINLWGDVSLTLFLSMSLMSMQLLMLSSALRPILFILTLQVAVMALFAYFIVFRLAGRDYDAAVITAGFAGLGLGATPVGMANMRAITSKFGMSAKAFLIIPLLGAFFIDITNALVLQFFMGLPFFQ
jgi:glutamate:Na+ symporter, ESS family